MNSDPQPNGFKSLNLDINLLKAIEESGYTEPTPIQSKAIPEIMAGSDLQASAQTGTGKTAAFMLPALQRVLQPSTKKGTGPRILILVPTRELAMQVANESIKYSRYLTRTKTVCIYGGMPYPVQNRSLARPYEILVATPGRLIDHISRGRIDLSRVEILILDEADRMLDMGFIEPVEEIAAATPSDRQTLLFSATLKGNVLHLSQKLLRNPVEISVAQDKEKHENIEQHLLHVDNIGHKHRLLDHLLTDSELNQAIVFTSTKISADQLVDTLYEQGHNAAVLHGDMNQRQRTRTISQLRQQEIRVLVATDVAARGIDVCTITHVINFDLPNNAEDYVHRIGRTGRAGSKGIAMSFAAGRDLQNVRKIEQFTGQKITLHTIPGLEPKTKLVMGSSSNKSRSGGGKPRGSGNSRSFGQGSRSSGSERSFRSDSRSSEPDSRSFRSDRSDSRSSEPDSRSFRSDRSDSRSSEPDSRSFRSDRSDSRSSEPDSRSFRSDSRSSGPSARSSEPNSRPFRSDSRSSGNSRSFGPGSRSTGSGARSFGPGSRSSESDSRSSGPNARSSGPGSRSSAPNFRFAPKKSQEPFSGNNKQINFRRKAPKDVSHSVASN